MKLLIVDDSAAVRTIIKMYLTGKPYTLFEAGDIDRALKVARLQKPEVVLCDLEMPGGSGLDLFKRLRADGMDKAALILLTASLGTNIPQQAKSAGANCVLMKPVTQEDLLRALEKQTRDSEGRPSQ
jgi:two-component system chemotaxis sensor kinase CheA